ncbi:MAG: hypothetical protein E5X64_30155 [Mesorhizobium sp.]|nr:MAG: hypothetical protein E5X64_30155 [Mesorhizobium sp.]
MSLVPVNLPYQPSIAAGVWQIVRQFLVIQQKALWSTAKPARRFTVLSLSPRQLKRGLGLVKETEEQKGRLSGDEKGRLNDWGA